MRIWISLLISISFIFLLSCTPVGPTIIDEVPTPLEQFNETTAEEIIVDDSEIFDIYRFPARDVSVFMFFQDGALNVINCGDDVYGPVIADEVARLLREDQKDVILRITNSDPKYIRGCDTIVTSFNMREIHLYVPETDDTIEITRWVPAFDRYFHDEEYILVYKNAEIDFSKITSDGLYINGTELIYR